MSSATPKDELLAISRASASWDPFMDYYSKLGLYSQTHGQPQLAQNDPLPLNYPLQFDRPHSVFRNEAPPPLDSDFNRDLFLIQMLCPMQSVTL